VEGEGMDIAWRDIQLSLLRNATAAAVAGSECGGGYDGM